MRSFQDRIESIWLPSANIDGRNIGSHVQGAESSPKCALFTYSSSYHFAKLVSLSDWRMKGMFKIAKEVRMISECSQENANSILFTVA